MKKLLLEDSRGLFCTKFNNHAIYSKNNCELEMKDFAESMFRLGLVIIAVFVLFRSCSPSDIDVLEDASSSLNSSETTETKEDSSNENEQQRPLILKPESEDTQNLTKWIYEENFDEMRGEKSYFASSISLNSVRLDFPYNSQDTHLSIILRSHANLGNDVVFATNQGQLYCEYRNCYVSVKFDDGPVQKYSTLEASGGSSEVLFLENDLSGFVNKLKSSERVMVEVQYYDRGAEQFKFDVAGLDWSHF